MILKFQILFKDKEQIEDNILKIENTLKKSEIMKKKIKFRVIKKR